MSPTDRVLISYGGGRASVHLVQCLTAEIVKAHGKPISRKRALANQDNWLICPSCLPLRKFPNDDD